MKSLEIVNTAKIKPVAYGSCVLHSEELETIKQDLEVLAILKKYLGYNIFIRYLPESDIDIDEYKKVMKWLEENENDR